MLTLHGLPNCDTCRRARALLDARGIDYAFVDLAATPPDPGTLHHWLTVLGEQTLVNRRSTTWRGLDEATRRRPAAALLALHPKLIKRPVMTQGARVVCGGREADWLAFAGIT